jgi:hypothetical protein
LWGWAKGVQWEIEKAKSIAPESKNASEKQATVLDAAELGASVFEQAMRDLTFEPGQQGEQTRRFREGGREETLDWVLDDTPGIGGFAFWCEARGLSVWAARGQAMGRLLQRNTEWARTAAMRIAKQFVESYTTK